MITLVPDGKGQLIIKAPYVPMLRDVVKPRLRMELGGWVCRSAFGEAHGETPRQAFNYYSKGRIDALLAGGCTKGGYWLDGTLYR